MKNIQVDIFNKKEKPFCAKTGFDKLDSVLNGGLQEGLYILDLGGLEHDPEIGVHLFLDGMVTKSRSAGNLKINVLFIGIYLFDLRSDQKGFSRKGFLY